ncbi:protein of unknown function DUF262 [Rippkaea orientalis PCC 8801]|uniref:GmrSD restriction endonucleases N-terminal domain-containing protein n=1 Tax=Rippkaea orientalis (strain PCC 8801 / RF-1) TaxID=41431 RepID=B7K4W7_RIPO1|nr:DUF262 domain-containing protein [Rippkaea orientalis]ACK66623.1 protein of unknown function DUF262 [Rippkaea orientalis PCC 8801]
MTNQIKPSVTNPPISTIYQNIASGKLILQPDFQRKFVWTHDHMEQFIDTILKGYPFPEIYVCQGKVDLKTITTTEYVIDGQQRLTTIKRYIDGEFDKDKPLIQVPTFDQLTETQQEDFLSYQIVVRDIGKVDDKTVKEIFRRINLTKFNLGDVEIHNAVYNGEFIQTAKEIVDNINLEKYEVFYESELTRMADLHFILLVMSTLENGGYFPSDKEIEQYIANYNDKYTNKNHIKALLIKTFAIINDFDLPLDSIWFRKSNFFTLVVELAKQINNLPSDITDRLNYLESKIMENKNRRDNEYGEYYACMYTGTTNRKARVIRAEIFNKHIFTPSNQTPKAKIEV